MTKTDFREVTDPPLVRWGTPKDKDRKSDLWRKYNLVMTPTRARTQDRLVDWPSTVMWLGQARCGGPAAYTHINKVQVLHFKCLRIATNARGFVDFILRRPHQSSDCELWVEVSRCGDPLSSATWKAPMPTKGRLKSPEGNRGGLTLCRPVEAAPKKAGKSSQRLV
jgi:hypothetical protein